MTTLDQWCRETNAELMFEALGDAADEHRCKLFVKAIRKANNITFVDDGKEVAGIWTSLARYWCGTWGFVSAPANACDIIRCIWADRFFEPRWRTSTVIDLARYVKEGNDEIYPILADALMDAGCDNEKMLSHLRQGPHFIGCGVIDALS